MSVILYLPQQPPQAVPGDGLDILNPATGLVEVPEWVPALLDCAPELVDVLASGTGYVVYSVFDYEGPVNHSAMAAVAQVTGVAFDARDEDMVLCGPVLVIKASNPQE
jgi:hypothetical protein